MTRVIRTWETSIVEKLKRPFGWQENEASNEVGRLIRLPNRNTLSALFLAAAVDFRYRIYETYGKQMRQLMERAKGEKVYPSMIIPQMQQEKAFPKRSQLEELVNEVASILHPNELKTDTDKQIYLREKDEIVSYFLLIIDSESNETRINTNADIYNFDEYEESESEGPDE